MAVVEKFSDSAKDPSVQPAVVIPSGLICARNRTLLGKVALSNGDSAASIVHFGKVPSSAYLRPSAKLFADAIAGATSVSLGDATYPTALMSAVNISAGGSFAANSAVAIANYTKQLWQMLGYAADPGGEIDIILTLNTALTASGVVVIDLPWALD